MAFPLWYFSGSVGSKLATWIEDILYLCARATSKSSDIWLLSGFLCWICRGSWVNVGLKALGRCTTCFSQYYGWSTYCLVLCCHHPIGDSDCSSSVSYLLYVSLFRALSSGEEAVISFASLDLQIECEPNCHSPTVNGMDYSTKLELALEIDLCWAVKVLTCAGSLPEEGWLL